VTDTAPVPVSADAPAADAPRPDRVSPEELRTLFLFEHLDDEQLGWLSEHGRLAEVPGGAPIFVEGEPAEFFYLLLEGTAALSRRVQGDDVEVSRTNQRGVYAGATQAYLGERAPQTYAATWRAVTDVRLFELRAEDFAAVLQRWFPMAMHLLEGLFFGLRASEQIVAQRERLIALGAMSAGLTHELNNPAAAAGRATEALRDRVAGMRHKLALLAHGNIDPDQLEVVTKLQDDAVSRVASAPTLSAMQTSDAEDELGDWLEDHGVAGAWELASVFVASGLDVDWAERVADAVEPSFLEPALRWMAYALESELLMNEISDATRRISSLVGAAKQYSQLDRAPHQWVDVHEGLDSTLVMLRSKIGDRIRVVKEYDRSLPAIPAYPAELNQVWTNLIDNAVAAMGGQGTLTVRTSLADDRLLVEIADTGPGVAPEIRKRIFEPFFTTKPVGEGTGLGLDISYRIVTTRHGGDLRVESEPGDTRFQVRLPLNEPPSLGAEAAAGGPADD